MIVYAADKQQFLAHNNDHDIEDVILERYTAATGRKVSHAESESWKHSLGYMARVLSDPDIPDDLGVAVELHLPQSSKRLDITLTGFDAARVKKAVVVELKQWQKVQATTKDAIVVTQLGKGLRPVVHPSYQAWSYAALLEGFNEAVYDGGIMVQPCAYLHNYVRDGVIDAPHYAAYIEKAPLFTKGGKEREQLRAFIKQHVKFGDAQAVMYELARGRIRPSKALAESLKGLMAGKPEFVLIDDQKEVFEACLAAARSASAVHPRVVLIEGGPGTGKTVLAINLLVRLTAEGLLGKYVSKNAAPRRVYEAKLAGSVKKSHFSNLFTGSSSFIDTAPDTFDFLIVDEAHRLTEKGGLYGNLGENQIKELIQAAKCTIFFIDEDQRVTLSDIGSKQAIRGFAKVRSRQAEEGGQGAEVESFELVSQFRCGGSDGYLAWLDNTLQVRETANERLDAAGYEFKVFDSPEEMHAAIEARNAQNRARVVAGYCWPWNSKKDSKASDIVIGETYRRQWNLDQDGSLWIMAEHSIAQVGCIHTCQGLEVDYIGVIIGPDLVVREGQVRTVPAARDRHDRSIRGYKTRMRSDPVETARETDLIIKNTYRTLMTRGMRGCYVYCTDAETARYFRHRLSSEALPTN